MSDNKERIRDKRGLKKEQEKGKKRPLNRSKILKAAFKIADRSGLTKVSMRSVADKLGCEAMSLYNHVKDKNDILDGIADMIFAELDWPFESKDWQNAMLERAVSLRGILKKHPWATGVLESRANPGPMTLKHHDQVLGCLLNVGFSLPLAGRAFSALDAYIYGFVMQEQNLPFENPEELKYLAEMIVESFPQDEFPHLFRFTTEYVLKPGYSYENEFLEGLKLLLDSLNRQLTSPST